VKDVKGSKKVKGQGKNERPAGEKTAQTCKSVQYYARIF
jgi:hypothetical protein